MKKGLLIVIEGACDGIGKSTQYSLLTEALEMAGCRVVRHHFPSYGTPQGAPVEAYLSGQYGSPESLSPYFVNSLYAVDRAVTWQGELGAGYASGDVVLLDRYTTSSLIYQSAGITDPAEKQEFIDYVSEFEYEKLGIPRPDLVVFLDAPFETAAALRSARATNDGVAEDIHETDTEFMRRVWDSAQFVCDRQGWSPVRCVDDCGNILSREEIHAEVLALAENVLREAGIL